MLRDIALAWRALTRAPGFALTAIVTVALGVGGTTAVFGLVDAVLLQPLPYRDPDRIVRLWETRGSARSDRAGIAAATFDDWQSRATTLDAAALFDTSSVPAVLGTGDAAIQIHESSVTPNLFALLGVAPHLGRVPEAGGLGGRGVLVSHALWRSVFAGDPSIVGREVRLEGAGGYVIAGVMPEGFAFPAGVDLWQPIDLSAVARGSRSNRMFGALARLRDGVSIEAAAADLRRVAAEIGREHPGTNQDWSVDVASLHDAIVGRERPGLVTLFGAVGFVLLVACANLSNLLLARGVMRRRELAVRVALGASRGRLCRLLFVDALAIAAVGGVAGWLVAVSVLPLLVRLAGPDVPRLAGASAGGRVMLWCVAASALTAVTSGLIPALRLSKADLAGVIAASGERSTASGGDLRPQRVMVTAQLALCVMLLVGAMLLAQTFVRLQRVDLGFEPANVIGLDARVPIYRTLAPNRWQLLARDATAMIERVRAVPGVDAAAVASDLPLGGDFVTAEIALAGDTAPRQAYYHRVGPGYFRTVGMTLVEGRDFTAEDLGDLARAPEARLAAPGIGTVIVNETTARAFWPKGGAIGQTLSTNFDPRLKGRRVIGVVRDARSETLRQAAPAEVYTPYLEDPSFAMTVLVRTRLPVDRMLPAIRREVREVSADISLANLRTLDGLRADALRPSRFNALVVSAFAGAGLVIAAVGVFGVFAFGVAARLREIGVRIALGAAPRDIVRLFLAQAAWPVAAGVACGALGAFALGRFIAALLFEVAPSDPATFFAAAGLLAAVAMLASYLPVRRALRADPVQALRR